MATPRKVTRRQKAALTACKHTPADLWAIRAKVMDNWADEEDVWGSSARVPLRVNGQKYEVLGHGCARTAVALCGRHVLKVDRNGCYSQVSGEVNFYIKATAKVRRILAPIYAYAADYSWELVRRCEKISWSEEDASGIGSIAAKYGISDIGGSNVGRIGKRVVVLDYGLNNDNDESGWEGETAWDSSSECDCTPCREARD